MIKHYEEQRFAIPSLIGISQKTIDEHIKLYSGYVKNLNLIYDHIEKFTPDAETNAY